LREPLSELLEFEVRGVESKFKGSGFSGGVFRIDVVDTGGPQRPFILKKVPDSREYDFYRDVLAPYGLDSPEIYGLVESEGHRFLVIEHVPHDDPDWGDPKRYQWAIDWLIRKDRNAGRRLDEIASLSYVRPFEAGHGEERLRPIGEACREGVDRLLDGSFAAVLEANAARVGEWTTLLRRGPQTVTHNDFQLLNVVIGKEEREGELYVIDWTHPSIGSVCIDLATLVQVAPDELQAELIERYRWQAWTDGDDFEEIFEAARGHVNLSILTWMIDALQEGQTEVVWRPKLKRTIAELREHFSAAIR
jgi:aminoglycoside phosphotransferase (APT) family kinase protein